LTNTQGNFGNHDRKEVLAHYQADLKLPEKEEKGQHRDVLHLHELIKTEESDKGCSKRGFSNRLFSGAGLGRIAGLIPLYPMSM